MRRFLLATALALLPATAGAEGLSLSREFSEKGLSATEARLAALPSPSAEESFALAASRFLGAVEKALQLRWQTGLEADWSELPILRLPIPANPDARALKGEDITALVTGVDEGMEGTRAALTALGDQDFGLELDLADIWFDINMNGSREEGETAVEVAANALGLRNLGTPKQDVVIIRFDGSDAAWLSAYSNLLSAFAKLTLAYDPAPAVDRVLQSNEKIYALWGDTPPNNSWDMMFGSQLDRVVMILDMLAQEPDAKLTHEALAHLHNMIAENRRFWTLVEAESDNDREWVPNERQNSALGITLPKGTGQRWQGVLAEMEQLIEGKLLIPHWRFGAEAGINIKTLFQSPPRVDLVGMIQGRALLPYAEKGPQISGDAWFEFERLVGGDAALFAVFFN